MAVVIYIDSSSDDEEDEDVPSIYAQKEVYVVHDSDSESESGMLRKDDDKDKDKTIADLAREFGGITIAHSVCLHARRRGRRPTTE